MSAPNPPAPPVHTYRMGITVPLAEMCGGDQGLADRARRELAQAHPCLADVPAAGIPIDISAAEEDFLVVSAEIPCRGGRCRPAGGWSGNRYASYSALELAVALRSVPTMYQSLLQYGDRLAEVIHVTEEWARQYPQLGYTQRVFADTVPIGLLGTGVPVTEDMARAAGGAAADLAEELRKLRGATLLLPTAARPDGAPDAAAATLDAAAVHANALYGFVKARLLEVAAANGAGMPSAPFTEAVKGAYALGLVDAAAAVGDYAGATAGLNTLHRMAANWREHPDNPDADRYQWQPVVPADGPDGA